MKGARRDPGRSEEADDLVVQLRTFANEIERYVGEMSHVHTMHRTDLAAISMVMDQRGATPSEISAAIGLSPSATSAMLDRLERAGHVERVRDDHDRRSVHVQVTDSALDVGAAMFGLLGRHLRSVLADVDDGELARTAALVARLNEAVRAARDEARDS